MNGQYTFNSILIVIAICAVAYVGVKNSNENTAQIELRILKSQKAIEKRIVSNSCIRSYSPPPIKTYNENNL